jgi:hypothetical protein
MLGVWIGIGIGPKIIEAAGEWHAFSAVLGAVCSEYFGRPCLG